MLAHLEGLFAASVHKRRWASMSAGPTGKKEHALKEDYL